MKNWKMKNKLYMSFGCLIVLCLLVALGGLYGMKTLNERISVLMNRTMPNTERVLGMNRNLQSEGANLLLALSEEDTVKSKEWLDAANEELEANIQLLDEYREHATIDKSYIQKVEECIKKQDAPRKEFHRLMRLPDAASHEQAKEVLMKELIPLLADESALLKDVTDAQRELAKERSEKAQSLYFTLRITSYGLIIVAILIALFIMKKLLQTIMLPLNQLEAAAAALRNGDFSAEITYESKDELGITCRNLQESFNELQRIISVTERELAGVSKGDFSITITEQFPGETQAIQESIKTLLAQLNNTFVNIKMAAEQIDKGSNEVSDGAQALAQGATEQTSTVDELSTRLGDVSEKVTSNAEHAKNASALASESGKLAHATLEDMGEMIHSMSEISARSQDISKVIKVIEDIAFQTNILALNAAVEAARAGSAGKGFAVVADEVRNLAQKSAEAAQNTTALIESSIATVQTGVEIANKTNSSFEALAQKVEDAVGIIDKISEASVEQASSIHEITLAVDQISSVVQTNSATSEESAAASQELSSQASLMNHEINQFKLAENDIFAAANAPVEHVAYEPQSYMAEPMMMDNSKY